MNNNEDFRSINILYYTLLGGQIIFALVILFVASDPETRTNGWPAAPFGLIIPAFFAGTLPLAYFINQQRLTTGANESGYPAKIAHYRSTMILRSAIVEGANLFCLVIFLQENNTTYLLFFAVGLLMFLYLRPSVNEFVTHYALTSAEKAELGVVH